MAHANNAPTRRAELSGTGLAEEARAASNKNRGWHRNDPFNLRLASATHELCSSN
jgi:hypothetical protein